MRYVLLIAFLVVSQTSYAKSLNSVPKRFQGVWAQDKKTCGKITESYFEITENQTVGYESISDIKSIYEFENSIAIISISSGEGFTWLSTDIFELTSDGKVLLNKHNIKYFKCVKS